MVDLVHYFSVALTSELGILPQHAWIQVVTPQSVVANGIASLIGGRHGDLMITTEGRFGEQPDIVFYDVIGLHGGDGADLDRWVSNTDAVVIALTHELRPDLGLAALDRGADAAVSMSASVHDFLELMMELNRELGTALVIVTHAPELAARMQRTLTLENGTLQ